MGLPSTQERILGLEHEKAVALTSRDATSNDPEVIRGPLVTEKTTIQESRKKDKRNKRDKKQEQNLDIGHKKLVDSISNEVISVESQPVGEFVVNKKLTTQVPVEKEQSFSSVYRICSIIGELCITPDDGQKLYDLIAPELLAHRSVRLDFAGVRVCVAPFLNFAIGQLFRCIETDTLNHHLVISNLSVAGVKLFMSIMTNSQQYYSDNSFQEAVNKVFSQQSEDMIYV